MKIKYLFIGMLSSTLAVKAQNSDSVFQKKNISNTDVQLLFSYYSQDGNNSAVTGGIGTEKLNVYAPNLSIAHSKGNHTLKFDGGVDVISSASTDNIDFVKSSASAIDNRIFSHISYEHSLPKTHLDLEAKTGFSIESDYLSFPFILKARYDEPSKTRSYYLTFESFFDDLRWGRLNPDYRRPVKLIYPVELRYKDWFNIYRRNTFNVKTRFSQVINKRMIAAIFPAISYQHGLLSTPFHRVYFNNDSVRVENLPENRFKIPVAVNLNYFAGSRTILKADYNFYYDDWGILANAFQLESAVKLNPKFALSPFFRIYHQSAAKYFLPYGQHNPDEKYYTSDYDLSQFNSYKFGLGFRYSPFAFVGKKFSFNEIELRYSAYFQSNGLHAQSVSMLIETNFERTRSER